MKKKRNRQSLHNRARAARLAGVALSKAVARCASREILQALNRQAVGAGLAAAAVVAARRRTGTGRRADRHTATAHHAAAGVDDALALVVAEVIVPPLDTGAEETFALVFLLAVSAASSVRGGQRFERRRHVNGRGRTHRLHGGRGVASLLEPPVVHHDLIGRLRWLRRRLGEFRRHGHILKRVELLVAHRDGSSGRGNWGARRRSSPYT